MSATAQIFKTTDVLRLEVGVPPAGLRNLLKNPNGSQGAWGWITPPDAANGVNGAYLAGAAADTFDLDLGAPTDPVLVFSAPATAQTAAAYMYSEPEPVTAGQYVGGALTLAAALGISNTALISVMFWDSTGALLSTTAKTSIAPLTATNTRAQTPVVVVPGTAKYASLRVEVQASANIARRIDFNGAMLATAATAAELAAPLNYVPRWNYTNILSPAAEITVDRAGLTLGTLTATLRSVTLDPSVDPATIKPGNPIRLLAREYDNTGTYTGRHYPLFIGDIKRAKVTYDLLYPIAAKRSKITLTAVDVAQAAANAPQPTAAATIADVAYLVEGGGFPFEVNGSTDLKPGKATGVATNPNAKMIDQIALARDTVLGHAWASRFGVLKAYDANTVPTTVRGTFSEPDYNADIDIDFDTERCINTVTVTRLGYDASGATVETVYGPYTNDASIKQWGTFAENYTVAGLSSLQIETLAANVLAANATPKVRCNALTFPVATVADLRMTQRRAHLDLYDRVTVNNTRANLTETLRVASLSHTITPTKWVVGVGFASTSGVAMPQEPPPLPQTPTTGGLLGPAQNSATTTGSSYYAKDGRTVTVRLWCETSVATTQATTQFTLPVGFRPMYEVYVTVVTIASGALVPMAIRPDGTVYFVTGQPAGQGILGHASFLAAPS